MNPIDIGIIAIVSVSAIIGVVRGLVREFFGLISWIGAAAAAYYLYPHTVALAAQYIKAPMLADGVTYLSLFVGFLVLFSIFNQLLSALVKESSLGGIDRSLGFGFGVLRGALLLIILEITVSFVVVRSRQPEMVKTARLTPIVYQASDYILQSLPKRLNDFIKDKQNRASDEVDDIVEEVTQSNELKKAITAEDIARLKPKVMREAEDVLVDTKNAIEDLIEHEEVDRKKAETATETAARETKEANLGVDTLENVLAEKNARTDGKADEDIKSQSESA